jgi:hypothetical protein
MPGTAWRPSRPHPTPWTRAPHSSSAPSDPSRIRTSADCKPPSCFPFHPLIHAPLTHAHRCVQLRSKVFDGRLCDLLVFVAPKLPPLAAVALTIPVRNSRFTCQTIRLLTRPPAPLLLHSQHVRPLALLARTHKAPAIPSTLPVNVLSITGDFGIRSAAAAVAAASRCALYSAVRCTRGWGACWPTCHSPPLPTQTRHSSYPA